MSEWRHWADKHFQSGVDSDPNQSWHREVFLTLSAIPSRDDWQDAIDSAGFPLELDEEFDPTRSQDLVVCRFEGQAAGFEYRIGPIPSNRWHPAERFDGRAEFVTFGILTDENRAWSCALIAAAILCQIVDGLLVDNEAQQMSEAAAVMDYLRSELGLN